MTFNTISIYSVDQAVNDCHIVKVREMFVGVEHPIAGKMKISGSCMELSNAKQKIRNVAILLGQHTENILYKLLSLSRKEIDTLCNNKAI